MFAFGHQSAGQLPGSASLSWSPQGFLMSLQQAARHLPHSNTYSWGKTWQRKRVHFYGLGLALAYHHFYHITLAKVCVKSNYDSKCRLVNYHFLEELQSQVAEGMGTWKNQKIGINYYSLLPGIHLICKICSLLQNQQILIASHHHIQSPYRSHDLHWVWRLMIVYSSS